MERNHLARSLGSPLAWRRLRILVLAPIALLVLCDSAAVRMAPSSPSEFQPVVMDARAVESVLTEINPGLAPRTAMRIASAVMRYSTEFDLDPALVTAVIRVESSARPWVRSSKGAIGLMQVMPHMMDPMGLAGNAATIESNIQAGCAILSGNIRRLGEENGISAYFWGSRIRGVAYLEKVQEVRDQLLRPRPS
jgi:soluble lytic murein transglycosylase-like protein